MKLIIGNWCFNPKILTSLLALILFSMFVFLGFWQLDRSEHKRNLYSEFENRQSADAIDFNKVENYQLDEEYLVWRKLEATGQFLEQYQILLDNQVENTHAGYFVYTPFKLDQSDRVILVNRGWLLAETDRAISPKLVFSNGAVKINGVIKKVPNTGLLLKDMPPEKMNEAIYRVQRIDINELEELTQLKLLPYIIRLEAESEHGYIRNWRLPGSGESIHMGYAFQWFAFAAVLLLIYLILNFKKIQDNNNG